MDNKTNLPNGWSIPNDLAKRISELANNKPYVPEDDLKEAFNDLARDIALIEPNPVDWREGYKCV